MSCQEAPTSPRSDRVTLARAPQAITAQAAGSYIVVLSANASEVDARAAQLAAQHGGDITFTYHSALKGFAGHFPEAEIAAILGCRVGTVKSARHRAIAKLREENS